MSGSGRRGGYLDGTPDGSGGLFPLVFEGKLLLGGERPPGLGKLLGNGSELLEVGSSYLVSFVSGYLIGVSRPYL